MLARSHTHPPYPPAVRERTPGRVNARANERTNYVLILRSEPSINVPEEIRLRKLLKAAKRIYGFTATDIREAKMPGPTADRSSASAATALAGNVEGRQGE